MTASIAVSGIVAQAFRLLERTPISSLADDSEEAIAAASQYDVALGSCLADGDWTFASTLASLPAVDEPSLDPILAHVFQRPADLIRVQDVMPSGVRWRLDADRLRTDCPAPLVIRYTARITVETRLPDLFKTAVSYRLASLLAPRWTASINRADELFEKSEDYIARARRSDRRQASPERWDGRNPVRGWGSIAVQPGATGLGMGRGS